MATTEKTTKVEMHAEPVVETQPSQVVTEQPVAKQPMSRQSLITIVIISGVILFFIGTSLGFLIGSRMANRFDDNRTRLYNQNQLPGGMMRRGFNQDDTQTTPSQDTTNTNTQTN